MRQFLATYVPPSATGEAGAAYNPGELADAVVTQASVGTMVKLSGDQVRACVCVCVYARVCVYGVLRLRGCAHAFVWRRFA